MPTKKKTATPSPELTEIQADLLSQMQHGYQLETSTLEGVVLRRLKNDELLRPTSANLNTVKALEERGLIRAAKGRDPLTTIWRVTKKADK